METPGASHRGAQSHAPGQGLVVLRQRYIKQSSPVCQGQPIESKPDTGTRLSARFLEQLRSSVKQWMAEFLELQDREGAAAAGRVFKKLLHPLPRKLGRPRSPYITAAVNLLRQGRPWKEIPWLVYPDFGKKPLVEQRCLNDQLRRSTRMRLKREQSATKPV
jgi:hypothetical protein